MKTRILTVHPDLNYDPKERHCSFNTIIPPIVWYVDKDGIHYEAVLEQVTTPVFRTEGKPSTVTSILSKYGLAIDVTLAIYIFPKDFDAKAFLLALIATESGGKAYQEREEPSLKDYSFGICQILTSTAYNLYKQYPHLPKPPRGSLPDNPNDEELLTDWRSFFSVEENSIEYATAYIYNNAKVTYDPILLYASYNAGGIYYSNLNKWGLRFYGNSVDNFAKYYGDACCVLNR